MLQRALLRDAASGVWLDFRQPEEVLVARSSEQVLAVLQRLEAHGRQGGYAAGYLSYEAAPAMDAAYQSFPAADGVPLAVFGLFPPPAMVVAPPLDQEQVCSDARWQAGEDLSAYSAKIDRIRAEIGAGSLYQVNYTLRLEAAGVSEDDLFQRIGCSAPYGAFLDLTDAAVVSGSPELFFRLDGDRLESAPMKGTVARGATPEEDSTRRGWLEGSAKNRAENLMITDMVRNDLGRIARTGSVRADGVFAVQSLPTVWQMTSTVRAQTDVSLAEVFRGLFPAASITGAPKVASMALIRELEASPRGIYTGTIGYVGPGPRGPDDQPGISAQFNVAIRTAWVDRATGRATYGAGGGIVWDSRPEEEYEEVAVKSRALTVPSAAAVPEFELLETLGWSPGAGFEHLAAHLQRLAVTADYYGFDVDLAVVHERLDAVDAELAAVGAAPAGATPGDRWRVRLIVAADGTPQATTAPLQPPGGPQPVQLAQEPVRHDDVHLTFKTTRRGVYERAAGSVPDGVEALLWNDLGHVTESSIANLVFEIDGRRFTPPLADGLLPGVLRRALLETGEVAERSLSIAELGQVTGLWLINGLRGWRQAELLDI